MFDDNLMNIIKVNDSCHLLLINDNDHFALGIIFVHIIIHLKKTIIYAIKLKKNKHTHTQFNNQTMLCLFTYVISTAE